MAATVKAIVAIGPPERDPAKRKYPAERPGIS